jgi:thiol:disulfide interchange protein DsbD
MQRLARSVTWAGAIAAFPAVASAQGSAPPRPTTAIAVADAYAVAPGDSVRVGVLFRITPGWHVFWRYPGEVGLPTEVEFGLPGGFTSSSIQWPIPRSFSQPGDLFGIGYADSFLIWTTVVVPESFPIGRTVPIRVKADWMNCLDVCVFGSADLRLPLAVSPQRVPVNVARFEAWERRLPLDPSSPRAPALAGVRGALPPAGDKVRLAVSVDWPSAPGRVEWLPAPEQALFIDNVQLQTEGRRSEISFDASVPGGESLASDTLESLLVATEADGSRSAFVFPVPLTASVKPKSSLD